MSIKVSLSIALEVVIDFPKLMINGIGLIVLFKEKDKGFVIYPSLSDYQIGDYSVMFNINSFKEYEGEITLKNE